MGTDFQFEMKKKFLDLASGNGYKNVHVLLLRSLSLDCTGKND